MRNGLETILATIPAAEPGQRLLVVLRHDSDDGSRLQLRQQSWGEGLGWFTQSSIDLDPGQVSDLRAALGTGTARRNALPRAFTQVSHNAEFPRVLRADSA